MFRLFLNGSVKPLVFRKTLFHLKQGPPLQEPQFKEIGEYGVAAKIINALEKLYGIPPGLA
jgi:hypothetical protein